MANRVHDLVSVDFFTVPTVRDWLSWWLGCVIFVVSMLGCSGAPKAPRVLFIGVDGLEWSVIVPMVQGGDLPHLRALMELSRGAQLPEQIKPYMFGQLTGILITNEARAMQRPLWYLIGILALGPLCGEQEFSRPALSLVTSLLPQAGIALENAQLFEATQEARQRYAGLFEDSIDPILITDLRGIVTDANHRAEAFLGYARTDLLGLSALGLHLPESPERIPEDLGLMGAGETLFYNARATHRDGHPIPIEVHLKRIDLGQQPCVQWILRDISERQALDELRADLTSMIFHDLRSPLGNIISSLEVLQVSLPKDSEPVKSVLSIAYRSSRRLLRLVESLLDLNQLETGQAVLHLTESSISALIIEAVEEVHPVAEAKGHLLRFELARDLPNVMMDVDMIRRVIINLLENAIKYTRGEGRIAVSARKADGQILVGVSDTGPGIAPHDQERIFERFTRVHHEGRAKGLGLGLTFCRLAVNAHGGKIWVESEPGKGSIFYFTLPF